MSSQEFEAVIGLEVHCQLATDSKIFCSCRARMPDGKSVADVEPNSNTCPVCTAQPGSLPVLNKKVVEYAIKAGLATSCKINTKNFFARKNYFYPDLPKGYQISQYENPICEHGHLTIETKAGLKKVNIQRIHMEEDAGKSIHSTGFSLVNLNRAGVPLVEIVTGPDMKSSAEAGAYLRALYAIVTSLGICDGNMEEGNFRCDANVSVMPKGSSKLGTRAEIKNVNSFKFVEKAIEFEIARQTEVINSGGKVIQETRLYDSTKNATFSMRSKEEAQDYRYFPEPDLIPLNFPQAWVDEIKAQLPELPEQKKLRYMNELELSAYDAGVLTGSPDLARSFDETILLTGKECAKIASNLHAGELARLATETLTEIGHSKITPAILADIVGMLRKNLLSSTSAKQVIAQAWKTGGSAAEIVDKLGLKQVNDLSSLEPIIDKIIAASPSQVAEFKSGKEKLIGYFVGQVMKESGGKANPGMIQEIIKKKLAK